MDKNCKNCIRLAGALHRCHCHQIQDASRIVSFQVAIAYCLSIFTVLYEIFYLWRTKEVKTDNDKKNIKMEKHYEDIDYQMCKRCVMDTADPEIIFDENGICNHCKDYFEREKKFVFKGEEGKKKLEDLINKIREDTKFKKYDCVLGVSGGTDSSYTAYWAKKLGLRVLLVNLDNGYDREMSKRNIKNIVAKTGFDLYDYKVDFEEFKDLHLAYLKASVLDIEVVTDHAILAAIYEVANKKGIKYILSGTNVATEAIIPASWNYRKTDLWNLKDIHRKYGTLNLETFPTIGVFRWLYYHRTTHFIELLNYVDYNKKEAAKLLHNKFGWEDYGGKHYESIFTKFYQAYILPTKFGIDKRKAHLSTLICSGQVTRAEALKELEKPLYEKDELERDKRYVLKKLGLSEKEFEDLMKLPIKKHQEFKTDDWIYALLRKLKNFYLTLLGKS